MTNVGGSSCVRHSISFVLLMLLAGCGGVGDSGRPFLHLSGLVRGGQQPVTDATVQLYAAGTVGDGSVSTALLTTTVTTSDGSGNAMNANANAGNSYNSLPAGQFLITGDYRCPQTSTDVYLVVGGGNPGLAASARNPNLRLMTALGPCGSLSAATTVQVNEVTTIASTSALASFMSSYAAVASFPSDENSLQAAFAEVNELVDTSTGTSPGPALPAGMSAPVLTIYAGADVLASCVNSAGGVAGDGSTCGNLFVLTTPPGGNAPTDTVGAALNMAIYPTQNVQAIFDLISPIAPFLPVQSSAPSNWTLAVTPNGSTQPVAAAWPAMYGLDLWLPFTDNSGTTVKDVTGNGHDGSIYGGGDPATWAGAVGLIPHAQGVMLPNASGRPAFGFCAYFPAGGASYNYGFFFGLAVSVPGGGQNGLNIGSSYGPSPGIYHAADAYFPQIGRSNGAAGTLAAAGFAGIHCVEAIPGGNLDHIVVDGEEVSYFSQGSTSDGVGSAQLTAPMYIGTGDGSVQFGAPITIYSAWASTNLDSVAQAMSRTSSETARLESLGIPFGDTVSSATDSTCSVDGNSIDRGYMANNIPPSTLLNLDFPCTIADYSESGQPALDIADSFQDRAGSVYHASAARNIAYSNSALNSIIKFAETPQGAFNDALSWATKAHALGYKTIVTTMMSQCGTGYNGESGDQLAQAYNAILLSNADLFDWVDNMAAWPQFGATDACSNTFYFADGTHPSETGQPFYVANERTAFEGVYGTSTKNISAMYTQLPSDRTIVATGTSNYPIYLIDANSASFNSAGTLCVQNTGTGTILLTPVSGETIDGANLLSVLGNTTQCVRPVVLNATTAGASWTAH